MRVFSLKVADDDPVAVYLANTGNVSATLRAIVEAYLAQHGNNPPPPPTPASPTSGGGAIDYDRLGEVMYAVMTQVFNEHQTTIPQGAPLNAKANGHGKRVQQVARMETSTMVEREDDSGEAVPLECATDSPDEILRAMGMA